MHRFITRAKASICRHPSLCLYILAFLLPIFAFAVSSVLRVLFAKGDFALIFTDLEVNILPILRAMRESDTLSGFFASANPELRANAYLLSLSPLNLPMLLAPLDALRFAATVSSALRLGLAALSLAFFLRQIRTSHIAALALSLAYSLSSYAIVGVALPSHFDLLILFPLVVLGILRVARGRGGALLGSALGLSILLCPGATVSLLVFSVLLYVYFCIVTPLPRRKAFASSAVFSASLVLSLLASLAATASFLSLAKFSFSEYPFAQTLDFLDFCAKLLPGSFDGTVDARFPYLSVGVLPILLSVVFFSTKSIPLRLRISTGALWFLLFFSFSISAINGFYSLFIPSLPLYGHAYIFVFLLTATAAYAWRYLSPAHEKVLILASGVTVLFAMILQKLGPTYDIVTDDLKTSYSYISELAILWIPAIATVLFTAALSMIGRSRALQKQISMAAAILLIATVCFEGALSSYALTKMAKKHAGKTYLADDSFSSAFSDSVTSALQLTDKDALYRIISSSALTADDGLFFGYHSLTALPETVLSSLGISLDETGCFENASYPLALSLLGVRHYIERIRIQVGTTKDGKPIYDEPLGLPEALLGYFDEDFTVLGDEEEATSLFTSSLALPLIFSSHSALSDLSLEENNSLISILNDYFSRATNDASLLPYEEILPSTIFGSTVNLNVPGHAVYDGNRIRFKATTAYDAPLYFSLSSAYPRESTVSITANGTTLTYPLYEDSDADSTVTVPLGSYAADTLVEISINFQNSADGRFYLPDNTPLLWQENPTATRRAVSILKSRAATDFRFSGNRLSATVTTNGESAILTTLPYDYRIAVTLDGKKVETVSALGAFLAIPVSGDGEHQITLTLSAPVSTAPMVLSFLGAAMLASLAVLELLVYRGRLTLPYLSARKEERDAEVDES